MEQSNRLDIELSSHEKVSLNKSFEDSLSYLFYMKKILFTS